MDVKGLAGHRQRQAEETKRQVAQAARRLFAERGYHATTIAAISVAADVPEQTIYSSLGSKARILERITAQWMVDADTKPLAEQARQALQPADRLRLLAMINCRQLEVGSDVIGIYREAAHADKNMTATLRGIMAAREGEIRKLLDTLTESLAEGITAPDALDITLALLNLETYSLLVVERKWTAERYETWLGDLLVRELLG